MAVITPEDTPDAGRRLKSLEEGEAWLIGGFGMMAFAGLAK
jgi:hypothetical protein